MAVISLNSSNSATTSDITSSSNTLFPTASSTSSSSASNNNQSPVMQTMTKNTLEWLFLALAALVVASVIHRRLVILRQNGLPPSAFFAHNPNRNNSRRPQRASRFPSRLSGPLSIRDLADLPIAYSPLTSPSSRFNQRQTRAADIGEGGRRERGGPSDDHGEIGDKDILPAYDKDGGPPAYIDSLSVLHSVTRTGPADFQREHDGTVENPQEAAPDYVPEGRHLNDHRNDIS